MTDLRRELIGLVDDASGALSDSGLAEGLTEPE
jgi:hypothetical protein